MKWFKHLADASNDDFVEELEEALGLEGYARWWKMLEIIAAGMEKDRNDPSAIHTVGKWCEKLKSKRKILAGFLEFCAKKGKIKVFLFDNKTETFKECSGNVPGMFQESNGNVVKITCAKMLELRDEYSRKSGVAPDNVAQEAEAEANKDTDINTTPLPPPIVDNFVEEEKCVEVRAQSPAKKESIINNNFDAAAAACCHLLRKRMLAPSDNGILMRWLKDHEDFEGFVLPIIAEKARKYADNNGGKTPTSLKYFEEAIREKSAPP